MAFQSEFCGYIATCSKTAKGVMVLIACAFGRTPALYRCPSKEEKREK